MNLCLCHQIENKINETKLLLTNLVGYCDFCTWFSLFLTHSVTEIKKYVCEILQNVILTQEEREEGSIFLFIPFFSFSYG